MGIQRKFSNSASEAVRKELREGEWPVYHNYYVVGPEGAFERAEDTDQGLVRVLGPDLPDLGEIGHVYLVAPTFLKDPSEGDIDRNNFWEYFNPVESYSPLVVDSLFLEFAGLADEGEITPETMLDWVERYGMLGFEGRESRSIDPQAPDASGGPADSLLDFADEARRANAVLRLYEAATNPSGPDVEKIRQYEEWFSTRTILREHGHRMDSPLGLRHAALDWVAGTVRRMVAEECYPELYQEGEEFRQGVGFKSLLGAMYLQMMWLMTATGGVRRCKAPKCDRVITFEQPEESSVQRIERLAQGRRKKYRTRADKEFCDKACYMRWHYQKKQQSMGDSS